MRTQLSEVLWQYITAASLFQLDSIGSRFSRSRRSHLRSSDRDPASTPPSLCHPERSEGWHFCHELQIPHVVRDDKGTGGRLMRPNLAAKRTWFSWWSSV